MDELPATGNANEIRKCRNCRHFNRVSEPEYLKLCTSNGFCIMGKLTGDFSLYYEHDASECIAYIYSDANERIREQEHLFNDKYRKFREQCGDRRTHFGKIIHKGLSTLTEIPEVKHEHFTFLMENEKDIIKKYFVTLHRKELYELYQAVKISKPDYLNFIADLTLTLSAKWQPVYDAKKRAPNRGGKIKITTTYQGGL